MNAPRTPKQIAADLARDVARFDGLSLRAYRHVSLSVPDAEQIIAILRRATAERPSAEPVPHHDNHHNALLCPFCNPEGLQK